MQYHGLDGGLGVWSHGGRLAFVAYPTHFPIQAGLFDRRFTVTDTHGAHPHLVGRFPYDDHAFNELGWLQDGRRVLLLTSNDCGTNDLYAVPRDRRADAYTSRTIRATSGRPAWSPDGTRIAYRVQRTSAAISMRARRSTSRAWDANGTGVRR